VTDIDRAHHLNRITVTMPLGPVGQRIIDLVKVDDFQTYPAA